MDIHYEPDLWTLCYQIRNFLEKQLRLDLEEKWSLFVGNKDRIIIELRRKSLPSKKSTSKITENLKNHNLNMLENGIKLRNVALLNQDVQVSDNLSSENLIKIEDTPIEFDSLAHEDFGHDNCVDDLDVKPNLSNILNGCSDYDSEAEDPSYPSRKKLEQNVGEVIESLNVRMCEICCKTFERTGSFSNHMKSHLKPKPTYDCSICEKKFSKINHLGNHVSSVHDKEKFPCHICGKNFSRKCTLKFHHLRYHDPKGTLKRPICEHCGMSFINKGGVDRHKKTVHLKIRRFICMEPNCNKTFSDQTAFKRHKESIHQGLRFPCDICLKDFSQKTQVYFHKLNVHQGKTFVCTHCNREFNDPSNLRKHVKKHHVALFSSLQP